MLQAEDVFEYKIDELLKDMEDDEISIVLKIFSLLIYNSQNNTDIINLYKMLGIENFVKVLSLFDGRTIKFPSKELIKNNLLLSLVYYMREIENKSWDIIKQEIPFEISNVSYGIQIKQLNNFLLQKLSELVREKKK